MKKGGDITIDSINFIINDIYEIDDRHLKSLGITDIKRYRGIGVLGVKCPCICWTYKNIIFKYNSSFCRIEVKTHTQHLLDNKFDVTVSDKGLYEYRLNQILKEIFGDIKIKLELDRINYCVDIKFNNEELIDKYLLLCSSQNPQFLNASKILNYPDSFYRTSKRGQCTFNPYNKGKQCNDERYKGVLRLELQNKRPKIRKELEKNGIRKELDNYWSEDAMEEFYFKPLRDFFGDGKHMKLKEAIKIIEASNLSKTWQAKLIKFLKKRVTELDWRNIVKSKKTYITYRDKLAGLGINELCMFSCMEKSLPKDDGIDNLCDIAYRKAQSDYFK